MNNSPLKSNDTSFTLVCLESDGWMDVHSQEQVIAEDWINVEYAPIVPMVNYVVLCADCQEKYENGTIANIPLWEIILLLRCKVQECEQQELEFADWSRLGWTFRSTIHGVAMNST